MKKVKSIPWVIINMEINRRCLVLIKTMRLMTIMITITTQRALAITWIGNNLPRILTIMYPTAIVLIRTMLTIKILLTVNQIMVVGW